MKFGIKYKLLLAFVCVLIVTTLLNAVMASSLTNQQSKAEAYRQLSRQVILLQNELQALYTDLVAVSIATASDEKVLRDLGALYSQSLQVADDPSLRASYGVNKAASLNRLQLVLRSSGFSSVAVYLDQELSHYITQRKAGMVVVQDDDTTLVTTEKEDGNVELGAWRSWSPGSAPTLIAPQMPEMEQMQVSFTFPDKETTNLQIAIPIQGVIQFYVRDIIVEEMRVATPESLQAENDDGQMPAVVGMLVFSKVLDRAFLEETAIKTGLVPALYSPDGQHQQQLVDLDLVPAELAELGTAVSDDIHQQTVESDSESYYQVLKLWRMDGKPALILSLALSRAGTLAKIRQAVLGIAGVSSLILLVGVGAGYLLLQRMVGPIESLTRAVSRMGMGKAEVSRKKTPIASENLEQIEIEATDEVANLTHAFNALIGQLRQSLGTLEDRVRARTQRLEAAALLSGQLNAILEIDRLLSALVTKVKERFNYGHVHVYLLDEANETLVLAQGYGEVGANMQAQGHTISLNNSTSLSARAAREGQPLIVTDVSDEIDWQPHPLLAGVRSKVAVPIIREGRTVGVLTAYSEKAGGLNQSDSDLLQSLANQVAVTMTNARLFEQTTQAKEEAEAAAHQLQIATEQSNRRAARLQASAEVSRAVARIRDMNVLLPRVTELISEHFGYYHAGVFLVDKGRRFAVLRAANSPGGQKMLTRGHRLEIGVRGIVGRVTYTGEPRIALDVGEDAIFFDNPDLPDTRSEMALPLRIGDEIIGALDVQSTEPSAFDQEDVNLLSTMADQIAIAIESARLLQQAQEAMEEIESTHRQYLREQWEHFAQKRRPTEGEYRLVQASALAETSLTASQKALEAGEVVVINGNGPRPDRRSKTAQATNRSELAAPIKLRGQTIGVLDLQETEREREWTQDEIALVQAVADQVAQALETARLFDETRRRAAREQATRQITDRIRSRNEVDDMLQTAIRELSQILGAPRVFVRLTPKALAEVQVPAGEETDEHLIDGG